MAIGSAGYDAKAPLLQNFCQHPRVLENALLVDHEIARHRLAQRGGFGRDDVHQRSALNPRKHRGVDRLLLLALHQDHAAARSAQRLVGRGRRKICDSDRRRINAGRNETRVVRHVGHEQRADAVRNRAKALPIDDPRIGRGTRDDQLGLVLVREPLDGFVIDQFALRLETVRDDVEPLAGEVDRRAVRQMPTMREAHAENGVAGF